MAFDSNPTRPLATDQSHPAKEMPGAPESSLDHVRHSLSDRKLAQSNQDTKARENKQEETFVQKARHQMREQLGINDPNASSKEVFDKLGEDSYKTFKAQDDRIDSLSKRASEGKANKDDRLDLSELKKERADELQQLFPGQTNPEISVKSLTQAVIDTNARRDGQDLEALSKLPEEQRLRAIEDGMHQKLFRDMHSKPSKVEIDRD